MSDDDEFIREFLEESDEGLDQVDQDLVSLEATPRDPELLGNIFRAIHTIKGTAGFFDFSKLGAIAHAGENLLSRMRDGRLVLDQEVASALLETVDAIRDVLARIRDSGAEGGVDYRALTARLDELVQRASLTADTGHTEEPQITPEAETSTKNAMPAASPVEAVHSAEDSSAAKEPDEAQPGIRPIPEGRGDHPHAEFIQEFLEESWENLDRMDREMVSLEQSPRDAELLASVFRTIHTIKGTSGFFNFAKLGAVSHAGEHLLGCLRDGLLVLDETVTSGLLAMVDAVRELLDQIDQTGREGGGDHRALIDRLTALAERSPGTNNAAATPLVPDAQGAPARSSPTEAQSTPAPQQSDAAGPTQKATSRSDTAPAQASEGSIRVDVNLLNQLMDLVGELVLARNQLVQFAPTQSDPKLANVSHRVSRITTELQQGIMKTRMQPIGNIWGKFPRVVRDLAVSCGKNVRLELEGQDTELDKSLLEAIKDPLTHLIRNAVDHGIEVPELRIERGKPATGRLFLRAWHEGGQVNIEISDDGGGIDPQKIKAKATSRDLITASHAEGMSDRDALQLIFRPGFSTAETVTDVSGRGVGMDVVRTNIENIGGTADLHSNPGQGTTFRVRIPLTLAIVPALIVSSGGERFAIPQVNLVELLHVDASRAHSAVEFVGSAAVYRLRGKLLPLVYLDCEFGITSAARSHEPLNIVVVQADERRVGVVVDAVHTTEEIVVKPLDPALVAISLLDGATIMGDGRVALILDVCGLADRLNIKSEAIKRLSAENEPATVENQLESLLVCALRSGRRVAIPLMEVDRLEDFPVSAIERTGDQQVVQYRNRIMPLVSLSQVLREHAATEEVTQFKTVVIERNAGRVGIVVDSIVDVVETSGEIQPAPAHTGIRGAMVIGSTVTDVVDVSSVIKAAGVV